MNDKISKYSEALLPTTFEQVKSLSEMLANSDMVPKEDRGKPGNIFIKLIMGAELGVAPMQAIQNICVINNRPAVWGDLLLALAKRHPECEDVIEERIVNGWQCRALRRGKAPVIRTFTTDDAKKAGLIGKAGPWSQYTDRMLQMRARGFAVRDAFPDALRGLSMVEETQDYVEATVVDNGKPSVTDQIKALKEKKKSTENQTDKQLPEGEHVDEVIPSDISTLDSILQRLQVVGYELSDKEKSRLETLETEEATAKAIAYFDKKLKAMEPPEDEPEGVVNG